MHGSSHNPPASIIDFGNHENHCVTGKIGFINRRAQLYELLDVRLAEELKKVCCSRFGFVGGDAVVGSGN